MTTATRILKARRLPLLPGTLYCGTKICDGVSAVPAGAGMEPRRRHAQQAHHVQLAHLGFGALADADL